MLKHNNVLCNDLKKRLTQNRCWGPRGPQRTRLSCNFYTTGLRLMEQLLFELVMEEPLWPNEAVPVNAVSKITK